jgi:uncharacterized protein (DUF983 family)
MFLGTLLHFVFELTGNSLWVAAFVPVNESVWEHLKLGYTSFLIFGLIEYRYIGKVVNNFWMARLRGILTMNLFIVVGFQLYTLFTVRNIFWIDISLYVVGGILCQYEVLRWYESEPVKPARQKLSLAAFILIGIIFAWFTWNPPAFELFMDKNTSSYGIYTPD